MSERWMHRLRLLFRKSEVELELDDELRTHIEMEAEDLVRAGMAPEEARREALLRFGGVERTKERVRDERGGRLLEDLIQDARIGSRSLLRAPGFALNVILVLTLGIGATVTLFASVDAVLLEPLPYPSSDRLVRIWPASPSRDVARGAFSYPNFLDWREQTDALDRVATYSALPSDYVFLGPDGPVEMSTEWVAGDFFEALEVSPTVGRTLTHEDAELSRHAVVLAHHQWQQMFGGDETVVGSTLTLDYRSFEIIGVMPPDFTFPVGEDIDLWVPLTVIPEDDIPIFRRNITFLQAFGRLAPGVTAEAAQEQLAVVSAGLAETYAETNAGVTSATVTPMREWMVGDVRQSLWVALGAVGLILLLACSNVANLLLARGTARAREVALRKSLGAPAERIARQLLTESLVLSAVGGFGGIVLAWMATTTMAGRAGGLLPRGASIGLDATVLGVAVVIALGAAGLAGILPAIRSANVAPARDLQGARGAGPSGVRLRRALVAAEVAFAVLLLTGAGLLGRSLVELTSVDPGFEGDDRVAMTLTIPDEKYRDRTAWMAQYKEILERLQSHPEVLSAGAIRRLPFRGEGEAIPVQVPGIYEPTPEEQRYANLYQVSEGFVDALGIQLLRGRSVEAGDGATNPLVAVVNEAFAEAFYDGRDPLGERFVIPVTGGRIEVIGVVADVHHGGLAEPPEPSMYVRNDQSPRIQMSYVVHTAGDPLDFVAELRTIVAATDPDQAITEILPMSQLVDENLARPRFFTTLLIGFATLALLLAAIGVYGVLAYLVRTQMRETGVRLALGASASHVAAHVVGQGMRPVLGGLVIGLLAAVGATRFIGAMLYGIEPLDGPTFGGVAVVLALAAVIACLVPAWFATRINPMVSMRTE